MKLLVIDTGQAYQTFFLENIKVKGRQCPDYNKPILELSSRNSRPEGFCKKDVVRNFTKFTGKHLCQSLFFNKVAGLRPAALLKKRLWHSCFPVNFVKFLRTPFFLEHLWATASVSLSMRNHLG